MSTVGSSPHGIAYDSANGNLYVANLQSSTVSVISGQTNTVVGNPISVPTEPTGIVVDPSYGNVYVASYADSWVSVISGQTNTVVGNPIPVGNNPWGIAYDSAIGNLYVLKSIAIVLMAIVVIMGFTAITTAHPAFALSKFFNCLTELANSHGHLTVADVNSCYHKEFHSA